jgi:hypothetical protein
MTDQNMNEVSFEIELLDKHKEYGTQYQSNDFFIGKVSKMSATWV